MRYNYRQRQWPLSGRLLHGLNFGSVPVAAAQPMHFEVPVLGAIADLGDFLKRLSAHPAAMSACMVGVV